MHRPHHLKLSEEINFKLSPFPNSVYISISSVQKFRSLLIIVRIVFSTAYFYQKTGKSSYLAKENYFD